MNGFFHWFKSNTKMKRWMFLILVGITLACYGIAEVLVMKEISFFEVGKIVLIFVIGFTCIVLGLIFLNKRTLEVLIESTDERMENRNNVNIKSLIFDKKIYDQGPNVVVIGGGAGLNTILTGLKNYTSNITAIVSVSDYGKEPSNSRKESDILPIGDIKDSIIALSSNKEEMSNILNYKFNKGKLKDLYFADLYFSAMKNINLDFTEAIKKSSEIFNMIGRVIPVTLDEMKICAELANGYVVEDKDKIPEIVYDKVTKINRVYLKPSNCRIAPGVAEAIKNADSIIIGPGSLYTNVIPNLLVNGVTKAIKESNAIKIFVSNIMTEPGQTDEYSISDHINAIVEHCGEDIIDYCIYDTGEVIPEFIKKYNKKGADLVEQDIDVAKQKFKKIRFLQKDLSVIIDDAVRHDANLVASSVIELICDDLKYQDKQNDPQYMMMLTKLKEDKRINKLKKSLNKKEKESKTKKGTHKIGKQSKFSTKYRERIEAIKESATLTPKEREERRERKRNIEIKRRTNIIKVQENKKQKRSSKSKGSEASTLNIQPKRSMVSARNSTGARKNVKTVPRRMKTKEEIKREMEKTLRNSRLGK